MTQPIELREWNGTKSELKLLASLNAQVHINQFFDKNGPLSGRLGNEFPTLKPYQSDPEFFERIWAGLAKSFNKQADNSYIYTAYRTDDPEQTPVGFVKGSEWGIDDLTRSLLPESVIDSTKIACLGSLYISPQMQGLKIGRLLTATFALAAHEKGYNSMVTHAYAGNTSPRFFIEKTGASYVAAYPIPNFFDDDLLERHNLKREDMPTSIPGVALFWNEQSFSKLLELNK